MLDKLAFAFIGAMIGWFLQQYRLMRSEEIALVNEHIKDIEKLGDSAQSYWLKEPKDASDEILVAGKVKAHHAATTLLYPLILKVCGRRADEYKRLSRNVYESATGGNFESADRKADPARAMESFDLAVQIVHLLRLTRTDIMSLRRFIWWLWAYLFK
ncbi:hypothetical protein [Mesorhizobium sp.]|uniref:hypothetical protein n=1 Tax=Mesorhizobium sp. TaxID=1871066 RepID=UPI003BABB634